MQKIKKMFDDLFTPNPIESNIYDITSKDKINEDGYFSLEIIDKKIIFRAVLQVFLLDEKDKAFRKGLEQFIKNEEEADKLASKYIHAFNKACSQHLTPFLHEPSYIVEGDGEPEWTIIYKDDMTEEFKKCSKNKDAIMAVSYATEKTAFRIVFNLIQKDYAGAKASMIKEAKDSFIIEKQQLLASQDQKNAHKETNNQPTPVANSNNLKIKIFSHTDKQSLETEVNNWLANNKQIELNGLEFKVCPLDRQIESTVFLVYK